MRQYTPLSWRCRHRKCGTGCGSDSGCCQERGAWYSVGLMTILGVPSLRGGTQYELVAGFVNQAKLLWYLE